MVGRASRVECSSSVDRRGVSLPEHNHHAHSDEGSNIRSSLSSTPLLELVMHYLMSLHWHPHTDVHISLVCIGLCHIYLSMFSCVYVSILQK